MQINSITIICYNSGGVSKRLYWQTRNKMALGFQPPMLYKSKGGGIMSDFEIFSVVFMVASIVLGAVELGYALGSNKKHKKK